MPNLKAAKKALRQNKRQRATNDRWRRKYRTAIKSVHSAVLAGDTKQAATDMREAQSVLDRAARRNIINKKTAARKKSRLQKSILKASAPSA